MPPNLPKIESRTQNGTVIVYVDSESNVIIRKSGKLMAVFSFETVFDLLWEHALEHGDQELRGTLRRRFQQILGLPVDYSK